MVLRLGSWLCEPSMPQLTAEYVEGVFPPWAIWWDLQVSVSSTGNIGDAPGPANPLSPHLRVVTAEHRTMVPTLNRCPFQEANWSSAFRLNDISFYPNWPKARTTHLTYQQTFGEQILRPHRKPGRPKHLGSEQGSTHSWDLQALCPSLDTHASSTAPSSPVCVSASGSLSTGSLFFSWTVVHLREVWPGQVLVYLTLPSSPLSPLLGLTGLHVFFTHWPLVLYC